MKLQPKDSLRIIQTHPTSAITTVNENGVCDAATFAWITPVSFDPSMLAVMVSLERYTCKNLEESGEFVVNVVTKHFLDELMKIGSESFRDNPNKLDESDFTLVDAEEIEPSRIEEAVAWLECKVEGMIAAGDHSVVVGKIVAAEVEDEFWEEGRFLAEKAETLHHLGENKFLVGGNLMEYEE